jgi:hypothetical protein
VIPPIFFQLKYEYIRKNLGSPFQLDGFLWASDGRVIVRAPVHRFTADDLAPFSADGRRLPSLVEIDHWWTAERAEPVPLMRGCDPIKVCPQCLPAWSSCYPLSPAPRAGCDSCGWSVCGTCDGDGWLYNMTEVPCGKEHILGKYAGMLEAAGVTALSPTASTEPGEPLYFHTDSFEGLLMPLDPVARQVA